jgi:hypothetical protein
LKNKELTQNRIFFAHFASFALRALRLILTIFKRKARKLLMRPFQLLGWAFLSPFFP